MCDKVDRLFQIQERNELETIVVCDGANYENLVEVNI